MTLPPDVVAQLIAIVERSLSLRRAALDCARRGFPVTSYAGVHDGMCTCSRKAACGAPGKHPAMRGWRDAATTDATVINRWLDRLPLLTNVAIVTGAPSGLIVLDIDPRNGGVKTLAALTARYGALPPTPTQLTGGGGYHYFFKYPGQHVPSRCLAPGIDLKGDGGAVVMAPSRHISGNDYRWAPGLSFTDVAVAAAPDWLVRMATAVRAMAPPAAIASPRMPHTRSSRTGPAPHRRWQAVLAGLQSRGPVSGPDASGNFRGRCVNPTHRDVHPSLDVHPTRGFICRACGFHGGLRKLAGLLGVVPAPTRSRRTWIIPR